MRRCAGGICIVSSNTNYGICNHIPLAVFFRRPRVIQLKNLSQLGESLCVLSLLVSRPFC